MKKRLQLHIYGKVQIVWYRASTHRKAVSLQLSGLVRNEPDGGVYVEIEGPEKALAEMVEWCKKGPEFARVTEVRVEEINVLNEEGFIIQR